MKRILNHNYPFYSLQEKFRKGKVSEKKIHYYGIKKYVRDGSSSPRKGLKEEKSSQRGSGLANLPSWRRKSRG